ncbi:hypothetical protein Q8F55_004940 [Vanrija albida]|uniref:Zinc finger Mcm10/DnaG-type domain-containing protein n=1 Tax=Vanrija albida TaxID=181172 RepID=A0ABR3Q0Q6_9TREE
MADDDLEAQLAAIQAKIAARDAKAQRAAERQAAEDAKILVAGTPPKKRPAPAAPPDAPPQPSFVRASALPRTSVASSSRSAPSLPPSQPAPSSLAERLAARRSQAPKQELPSLERTATFRDNLARVKAAVVKAGTGSRDNADDDLDIVRTGAERESDLTVSHDLRLGPGEFGPDPEGEHEWRALEPNSGIRLSSRKVTHAEVQDHLYGRYYLRPSDLYSVIRLSKDGATYDVPVEGDWVTIAVVAERGDIKVSGMREEKDDGVGDGVETKGKGKGKEKEQRKRVPKKYISLKLVSLPPRSKTLGGRAPGGDAHLKLLLFQADDGLHGTDDEGNVTKSYRGGSGGAYERWSNLPVGAVIALINPRVLRPLEHRGRGAPHPLTLPLALNPFSADSIVVIGQAMDMGRCTAFKADGQRCKDWVDTRTGAVCEYHVHAAITRGRSSRAEFASATTSMALTTFTPKQIAAGTADKFDPRKKTGLLPRNGAMSAPRGPENGGGGATYVVGTRVARTGTTPGGIPAFGDAHLSERLGRSQAEKRKRKAEEAQAEAALERLFKRQGGDAGVAADYLSSIGVGKKKEPPADGKRAFSAQAVRRIGFDPSGRRDDDAEKRLEAIEKLMAPTGAPNLGRGRAPKRLSNVVVPKKAEVVEKDAGEAMVDLD